MRKKKIFLLEITPDYASFVFKVSKSATTFCYHADLISSGGPDFSLSFGTGFRIQGCPLAELISGTSSGQIHMQYDTWHQNLSIILSHTPNHEIVLVIF